MFAQIKAYLYGAVALVILALGITVYVQRANMMVFKSDLVMAKANLDKVVNANAESQKTIALLKGERTRTIKTCNTIQAGYDAALAELVRIDGLTGGAHEHDGEDSVTGGSGDGLLDALNGLFPDLRGTEGRGANGVCQAGSPGDAQGTDVLPGAVRRYYFCSEQDVKNLLKNLVLKSGREAALVTIIEGQR